MLNSPGLLGFDWDLPVTDEDRDSLLGKVVGVIRKWRLEVPAILFLESTAPLGKIAGQGLVAFSPFAAPLFAGGIQSVQKLHMVLEDPKNIQRLIDLLSENRAETDAARK